MTREVLRSGSVLSCEAGTVGGFDVSCSGVRSSESSLISDLGVSGESEAEVAMVSAELDVVEEVTKASDVEEEEEERVGSSAAGGEATDGMTVEEGESEGRVFELPVGEVTGGLTVGSGGSWGFGVVDESRCGGALTLVGSFFSLTTDVVFISATSTFIGCDSSTAAACSMAACLISSPSPSPMDAAVLGEYVLVGIGGSSSFPASSPRAARAFWFAFFLAFLRVLGFGPGLSAFLIFSLTFLSMARAGATVGKVGDSGRVVTSMRSAGRCKGERRRSALNPEQLRGRRLKTRLVRLAEGCRSRRSDQMVRISRGREQGDKDQQFGSSVAGSSLKKKTRAT